MGQLISNDPYTHLIAEPVHINSHPKLKLSRLKTVSSILVPYYDIVYRREDDTKIEYVYKFLTHKHISLNLTKKINKIDANLGCSVSGGEHLYGYKIKYRYRVNDKIKNVLLKKRIYGEYQHTIDTLAQLKLLSTLQVGPYVGTMINGSDGYIWKGYLQYYSQNLINFKSNVGKLFKKIQNNFENVDKEKIGHIGFSVSYHDVVLKPQIIPQGNKMQEQQLSMNLPLSSLMPMTNSQNFKMSAIEDMITKEIKLIDEKTNHISAIQNSLIHKNIEKSINLYEQSLKKLKNPNQKFRHIFKFIQLLSDSSYFKQYQQQIVAQALDDSQLQSKQLTDGKDYRKQLQQKANILKLESREFSSQSQVDQFSHTYSINDSDIQKEKLKINIQDSNNMRAKQIMLEMNRNTKHKDQFNQQVSFDYAVMLMKSAKSRLALSCFQLLLRSDKVSTHTKFKICSLMGLIYYHKGFYAQARKQFELSISKMLKMRYYSPALVLAYNNIGCAFYQQFKYEQALQCYNCAMSIENWTNDYEGMLRNNRGITYLKLGMIKQAKEQFMLIINKGEPINNASILCKIYTNLGYMSMKSKQFSKAKDDFKMAIEIQERCLISNGYRPSPFLHNNMAMVRFKLKQFRQALDHFTKYMSEFQNLKSIQGVMVNYNIALAYKQCYKNQFANQHIDKCRRLISTLPQKYRIQYQRKIEIQAQNINRNNIDQVSDQSSGAVIDNMISTLTKRN